MNFMGKFIATLIIIDTFLVSYAVGFNSRQVLIEDASIKAPAPVKKDGAEASKIPVKTAGKTPPKTTAKIPPKDDARAHAKHAGAPRDAAKHAKTNGTINTDGPTKKIEAQKHAAKSATKSKAAAEPKAAAAKKED